MKGKFFLFAFLILQSHTVSLFSVAKNVWLCNSWLRQCGTSARSPKFIQSLQVASEQLGMHLNIIGTVLEKPPKDALFVWNLMEFYITENGVIELSANDWTDSALLLYEPPACSSYNYSYRDHWRLFGKVLTSFDDLVEGMAPSSFVVPQWFGPDSSVLLIEALAEHGAFHARQLCTTFMNSKVSVLPGDGYAQRRGFIEFMEEFCPEGFDWFGFSGHDLPLDLRVAWFGREKGVVYLWGENMHPLGKCWKGVANWYEVSEACKKYKFVTCYENQRHPGWITERIFQALFGGAVPVYWGAPNIEDYIPRGCYVDRRDFESNEELLEFMKNFTEDDYKLHRRFVEDFYRSDNFLLFSPENFADTVLSAIFPEGYDRHKAFPGERYEMIRRAKHKMYEMGLVTREMVAWALG